MPVLVRGFCLCSLFIGLPSQKRVLCTTSTRTAGASTIKNIRISTLVSLTHYHLLRGGGGLGRPTMQPRVTPLVRANQKRHGRTHYRGALSSRSRYNHFHWLSPHLQGILANAEAVSQNGTGRKAEQSCGTRLPRQSRWRRQPLHVYLSYTYWGGRCCSVVSPVGFTRTWAHLVFARMSWPFGERVHFR